MAYDLIIIGSGPGGYSAAVRAGQYGLKTAIIEKDPKLGGTCLHVGCIPTKALLHTADVWDRFQHSADEGLECENPRINYPKVLQRKNGIVSKHAKGVEFLMKKNKVDVIKGFGVLKGRGKVEVTSEKGTQTLETKNVIIATGSEARLLPGLKADDAILTNIEILDMPAIPKTLAVIGAGAVGRGIRVHFQSLRHQSDAARNAAAHRPRGGRRDLEGTGAPVQEDRHSRETGAKAEDIQRTETGVRFHRRPGQRQARDHRG